MVAGLNMLSFDLFGLGRKRDEKAVPAPEVATQKKTEEDCRWKDEQEHQLFFWSLYPVI
jgi:hypothetical protein